MAVTLTWDEFYVDYQITGVNNHPPAHTTARLALGIEDPAEAKQALIDAFQNEDKAAIKSISEVYNTAYDATALPDDPGLYLSAGPYVLESYDELTEMVFEANPDYTGARSRRSRRSSTASSATRPRRSRPWRTRRSTSSSRSRPPTCCSRSRGSPTAGSRSIPVTRGTYEHVDLVMNNGGPFDPAAYGGDEEKALMVRQAFLKTIPRQEIVDRLIVPLNPDAQLRDSFTTVVGHADYDAIAAEQRIVRVRRGRHRGGAGAARGGRRADADRRALPVRRRQPAASQRVRPHRARRHGRPGST